MREGTDKKKHEGVAKKKKEDSDSVTKRTVTIPYIKGVSEDLNQMFPRNNVAAAMNPHLTLKRMLVHPKDKRTPQKNAGMVYM